MTIDEFISKWFYESSERRVDLMKLDLEVMMQNSRTQGIWEANEAFDRGARLISLKRR